MTAAELATLIGTGIGAAATTAGVVWHKLSATMGKGDTSVREMLAQINGKLDGTFETVRAEIRDVRTDVAELGRKVATLEERQQKLRAVK